MKNQDKHKPYASYNRFQPNHAPDWSLILPTGITPPALAHVLTKWFQHEHSHVIEGVLNDVTCSRQIHVRAKPPTHHLPWLLHYRATSQVPPDGSDEWNGFGMPPESRWFHPGFHLDESEGDRSPSPLGEGRAGDGDPREPDHPALGLTDRVPEESDEDLPDWDDGIDDL